MIRKNILFVGVLILISTGVLFEQGCSSVGVNFFSKEREVKLGKDLAQQINQDPEYPIYNGDPALKTYINNTIFDHILLSEHIESTNIYNYSVEIIDRDDIKNAFALPGGYIYVYTGLLKYLDSEAALAGILAHEIAHIEERHATERLTDYYGVSFLVSLVLGNNPNELLEIGTNLFVGLAFLANSRADEKESDELAFRYLEDSRYYPGGIKFFFEHMRDDDLVSENQSSIKTFLSTHPDPIDRIDVTNARLRENGYTVKGWDETGQNFYRDEYKNNILSILNK